MAVLHGEAPSSRKTPTQANSGPIVTIDEHEVHHLGLLLEQLFPDAARQFVTIVNNPKGVTQVDSPASRSTQPFASLGMRSSLGSATICSRRKPMSPRLAASHVGRDFCALVMKPPAKTAKACLPVCIDADREAVLGAGEPLPFKKVPDFDSKIEGLTPVWPVRRDGSLGRWSVGRTTLRQLIEKGYVALGSYQSSRRTWAISYLSKQLQEQVETGVLVKHGFDDQRNVIDVRYTNPRERRLKTVWHRSSHDAGAYGTDLLKSFLGEKRFNHPKSLYAGATRSQQLSATFLMH